MQMRSEGRKGNRRLRDEVPVECCIRLKRLTNAGRDRGSTLLIALGAVVTGEAGDARLANALAARLITILRERSDWMTVAR